jgi:hypothetical protein
MLLFLRGSRLTILAPVVALLTAVPMSALPLLHRLGDADSCRPSAGQHDPAAHHIGLGSRPLPSPHCLICHWWESVGRFKGPNLPFTLVPGICFDLVSKTATLEPTLIALATRPARAPPVT